MRMNKKTWIILAGVAVLAAAFLLLNFRLAYSGTSANTNAVTASSGDAVPTALQQREKITLCITGEGPLVGVLQDTLAAKLREAGLGEVEVTRALMNNYPNPVLRVDVGQPGVLWTPFYGSSRFQVTAGFVSNGVTATLNAQPVEFETGEGPAVNMSAEYNLSDRSFGILSRPGYYQILADWLANSIVEAVRKLYEPKL